MGKAGASVGPAELALQSGGDETQFRWYMQSFARKVAAYNSYFDATGVDLILMPSSTVATPDLTDLAGGTCLRTVLPSGEVVRRHDIAASGLHSSQDASDIVAGRCVMGGRRTPTICTMRS